MHSPSPQWFDDIHLKDFKDLHVEATNLTGESNCQAKHHGGKGRQIQGHVRAGLIKSSKNMVSLTSVIWKCPCLRYKKCICGLVQMNIYYDDEGVEKKQEKEAARARGNP